MKKVLLGLCLIFVLFTLSACDNDDNDGITRSNSQEAIATDDLMDEISSQIKDAFN